MAELLSSFMLVFIAEMGDKTQLLSIILAARYHKFWPIFFGITAATLFNHAMAAYIGQLFANNIQASWLNIGTAIIFVVLGLWMLIPDKAPENKHKKQPRYGVFATSFIAFFIAEMGDKTQLATVTLGAQAHSLALVIFGTTIGMMAANAPAILCGQTLLKRIPLEALRVLASVMFIGYGVYSFVS